MRIRFLYLLVFLIFYGLPTLEAKHIVGGDVSYECLTPSSTNGVRKYRFTFYMYRDCYGGGASFDGANGSDPATFGLFISNANASGWDFQQRILISPQLIERIPNANYPCLIPPDVCVEKGLYIFDLDLPIINTSYMIAYQRCCRNETITNIYTPGNVGSTFSVELTPRAQELGNSSPIFNDFPPTVICAKQPLNYDHSAIDRDGDAIIYEFCSPLTGGGQLGATIAGDPYSCQGVRPNPPCLPASNVQFIGPNYTATRPMGGDPIISINPITGIISGTPVDEGQYVVGVCAKEYRDGELISETRRDFQFNVASCEPNVNATIDDAELIADKTYYIKQCGDYEVNFIDISTDQNFISSMEWEVNVDDTTYTSTQANYTFSYPDTGQYNALLLLNKGLDCDDTAHVVIDIFPKITADFGFEYDTCQASEVVLSDISVSGQGPDAIQSWLWIFEDNATSTLANPTYQYSEPGTYPIILKVVDINGCEHTRLRTIEYYPVPRTILVNPSTYKGCVPSDVLFENLSSPIDSAYTIDWQIYDPSTRDTLTFNEISPTVTFEEPGTYSAYVNIISPLGCQIDATFPNYIHMDPKPTANFRYSPTLVTGFNPKIQLEDLSVGANRWYWYFSGEDFSREQNPSYSFLDTGAQVIKLVVANEYNCSDSITKRLDVEPKITYYLPNAFTPNFDDNNDEFRGTGYLEGISGFQMTIWNRWGEMVFETNDPEYGWNGTKHNNGENAPAGVYVYQTRFVGPRGKPYFFEGYATLIR